MVPIINIVLTNKPIGKTNVTLNKIIPLLITLADRQLQCFRSISNKVNL